MFLLCFIHGYLALSRLAVDRLLSGAVRARCCNAFYTTSAGRIAVPLRYDARMADPPQDEFDRDSEGAGAPSPALRQPADSPIKIERFPDGLTIEVPAAGLWRGSSGLFGFAVIWNGIIGLISFCLLAAVFGNNRAKPQDGAWIFPLLLSLFWLVGIGLLLAAINMGRRRAALAYTGGMLMVVQTGLFGSKRRDWSPDDLDDVRVGPSGMTVNDEPVLELHIIDGGGMKFGLLAGRSQEELRWLAAELRAVLPGTGNSGKAT